MTCLVEPEPTENEVSLFQRIYAKAAEMLCRDGALQPVAFFRTGNHPKLRGPTKGMIVPVQMDMPGNDRGKDELAEVLHHLVKDLDADLVLMVLESWMVMPSKAEAEYIQQTGEFAVRPSQHPDRIEIVLFSISKPGGDQWSCWAQIQRDQHNKPSIPATPPKLEYLKSNGRFANLFEAEGGGQGGGTQITTYQPSRN